MYRSRSSSAGSSSSSGPRRRFVGPLPPVRRRKKPEKPPQQIVDEFWDKFTTKTPGKATTIIPHNKYATRAAAKAGWSVGTTTSASYEEAAALCRAKVEKIYQQCKRVNSKYTDPHFDLEFDFKFGNRDSLDSLQNIALAVSRRGGPSNGGGGRSKFQPRGVKRVPDIFEDPQFYIDGPTANDVRQGHNVGDCWLMAALCTLTNKPELILRICVDQRPDVGVYGFVFHRDGEWFSEIIDDKLYLSRPDYDDQGIERIIWNDRDREDPEETYRKTYQTGSGALYFAQCEHPNETWLPLLEKAYSKAHGDYSAIEGGFIGEGIEDLCGGVTTEVYTTDILDKEKFWQELLRVNQDFLFGCSTGLGGRGTGERQGIIEQHSYSVMKAVEIDEQRLCLLKNPWGKGEWKGPWSDGSKEWTPEWMQKLNHRFGDDGSFYIQYSDLLRKYQAFDRTRLFGPEWKVASIWTTLSVSWTHDYHDTHFSFVLERSGPVVVVLSQLDDRYFRGLEGQYSFELSFRIHKAGHKDYVVRSQTGYRLKRSVSVEIDLGAGEYVVLVKIDAMREERILPVEDVVQMYAKERREKLTRIGLAYDLAHSKGRIVETEEEKAAREMWEKKKREKEKKKLKEEIMKDREAKLLMARLDHKRRLRRHRRRKEKDRAEREKRMEMQAEEERKRRAAAAEAEEQFRLHQARRGVETVVIRRRLECDENRVPVEERPSGDHYDDAHSELLQDGPAQEPTPAPELPGPDGGNQPPAVAEGNAQSVIDPTGNPEELEQFPPPQSRSNTVNNERVGDNLPTEGDVDNNAQQPMEPPLDSPHAMNIEMELDHSSRHHHHHHQHENHPHPQPHDGLDRVHHYEHDRHPHYEEVQPMPVFLNEHPANFDPSGRPLGQDPNVPPSIATPSPPSSLSSLDSNLLDLHLEDREARARELGAVPRPSSPTPNGPGGGRPAPAPQAQISRGPCAVDDNNDDDDQDPWNAVVVVGLRVYYDTKGMKLEEGDTDGKNDDQMREVVKLRVVRPDIYEDEEEDEEDGKEKVDGDKGGGDDDDDDDDEKMKMKEKQDKKERKEKEEIPATGLDVDDSAKDATLALAREDTATKMKGIIDPESPRAVPAATVAVTAAGVEGEKEEKAEEKPEQKKEAPDDENAEKDEKPATITTTPTTTTTKTATMSEEERQEKLRQLEKLKAELGLLE